mgnify:CR=1 FL=1
MDERLIPVTRPWVLIPGSLFLILVQIPLGLFNQLSTNLVWSLPLAVTGVFVGPLLYFGMRAHRSEDEAKHFRFVVVNVVYLMAGSVTGFVIDGIDSSLVCTLAAFWLVYSFRDSFLRRIKGGNPTANEDGSV